MRLSIAASLSLFLVLMATNSSGLNTMLELERLAAMPEKETKRLFEEFNKGTAQSRSNNQPAFDPQEFLMLYQQLYGQLFQTYATATDAPKGKAFPDITGPPSKNSRIAIVGAGPSGCHMAYRLASQGYNNIVMYEQTNRVGGKSNDVLFRGTHYTTSTYLFTPDYKETMMKFVEDENLGRTVPWTNTPRLVNDYKVPPPPSALLLTLQAEQIDLPEFFRLATLYVTKHRELFGIYDGELMLEPFDTTLMELQGSFYDWLKDNGMEKFASTIDRIFYVPGYGRVRNIGAIHGLLWITPRYLVEGALGRDGIVAVDVDGGFTQIFRHMLDLANVEPLFDTEVLSVRRRGKNRLGLTLSSQTEEEIFDFLIWSGLPSDFPKIASPNIIRCDDHRDILTSSFHKMSAGSVICANDKGRAGTSEVYVQNVLANDTFKHLVHIATDVQAEYNQTTLEDFLSKNYEIDGIPASELLNVYSIGSYGDAINVEEPENEMMVRQKLIDHFKNGFGATEVNIMFMEFVRYLPQWSHENIGKGYHWRLFEMQGEYNIWFIGGGATWDSTKSVWEYNDLILRQAGIL